MKFRWVELPQDHRIYIVFLQGGRRVTNSDVQMVSKYIET